MNVFVDVSEEASAAIAYIVNVSSGGREIALISLKTENGPKKPTSILKMELQDTFIGMLIVAIINALSSIPFSLYRYWTDSRNVLC